MWSSQRVRHVAFSVWAAILSLLSGVTFVGVTVLTIGMWLMNQNPYTTPVTDLGFFALGAIIITTGLVVQLRAPEHKIAGVQQAVIGLLALGIAGLIGGRVEPLAGALLFFVATAMLVALHPARREFFKVGTRLSPRLATLSMLAAIPATAYAVTMLTQARQAGPSCFFGRCAYGDRFAELAALAIAIVGAGMLAAAKPGGWRVTVWSVGTAVVILGSVSIVLPQLPGALGQAGGALAVVWGVLFVAVAEWEARNTSKGVDIASKPACNYICTEVHPMNDKILVTYASRAGSTVGVAEAIGNTLAEGGAQVDVLPMQDVTDLTRYRAVVAGSAIQGGQWLPEAMHFVHTHRAALSRKPFAAFLVCMTLAMPGAEKYRQGVADWMTPVRTLVRPVSEGYFVGALDLKTVPSFVDRLKFRVSVALGVWTEGDHRDWDAIRAWARDLRPMLAA